MFSISPTKYICKIKWTRALDKELGQDDTTLTADSRLISGHKTNKMNISLFKNEVLRLSQISEMPFNILFVLGLLHYSLHLRQIMLKRKQNASISFQKQLLLQLAT